MKTNLIQQKSFSFSLKIIELYKRMINDNEFVISKQLLRSATSIGANVEEALAAQSRKDFIHKMSIACKEARETHYWLRLIKDGCLTNHNIDLEITEVVSIINILTRIIKTAQERN